MQTLLTAARFALLIMLLGGLFYPLVITGLGQMFFPRQANGSLIKREDGTVIGSVLIGQQFSRPEYFHPRPSVNGYDAANTGGSNLGATSRKLVSRIASDAEAYRTLNRGEKPVPIDAVTASASGLDPHISVANALAQAPRIAVSRKLPLETVRVFISQKTENILAEAPYVNVLQLNLALDRQ